MQDARSPCPDAARPVQDARPSCCYAVVENPAADIVPAPAAVVPAVAESEPSDDLKDLAAIRTRLTFKTKLDVLRKWVMYDFEEDPEIQNRTKTCTEAELIASIPWVTTACLPL